VVRGGCPIRPDKSLGGKGEGDTFSAILRKPEKRKKDEERKKEWRGGGAPKRGEGNMLEKGKENREGEGGH